MYLTYLQDQLDKVATEQTPQHDAPVRKRLAPVTFTQSRLKRALQATPLLAIAQAPSSRSRPGHTLHRPSCHISACSRWASISNITVPQRAAENQVLYPNNARAAHSAKGKILSDNSANALALNLVCGAGQRRRPQRPQRSKARQGTAAHPTKH